MSVDEKMSRRDGKKPPPSSLDGTLEGPELEAVEDWLENDSARHAGPEKASRAASPGGMERDDAAAPGWREGSAPGTPWHIRLRDRLRAMPSGIGWAVAAGLLVLVLVQALLGSGLEGGLTGGAADASFALVKFRPDTPIGQVAPFLSRHGFRIISGPGPDGVFRIAIPAARRGDYDKLFSLIAVQPFTESTMQGRRPAAG
jgi:hypothetical protein